MIKSLFSMSWKAILVITLGIIIAYTSIFYMGRNNPIELEVEKVIDEETGVKIDLTPAI